MRESSSCANFSESRSNASSKGFDPLGVIRDPEKSAHRLDVINERIGLYRRKSDESKAASRRSVRNLLDDLFFFLPSHPTFPLDWLWLITNCHLWRLPRRLRSLMHLKIPYLT